MNTSNKNPVYRRASIMDYVKSWPLYFLPHHLVSRVIYKLTRLSIGTRHTIPWFIKKFKVNMSEAAEQDLSKFTTFNAFFTRELKAGARPITSHTYHIACPADGAISATGQIDKGQLFQAKGRTYSLHELLAGDQTAAVQFMNGSFATVYLSPRDYHRVHMPIAGRLRAQTHVPGRLFSVAPHTARTIPRLFARNERLICYFDTSIGALAMIMVGAINVAAIETVWDGLVTPPAGKKILHVDYPSESSPSLERGAEMGRFNMGSTVILLFENTVSWHARMEPGNSVKMGEELAQAPPEAFNIIMA